MASIFLDLCNFFGITTSTPTNFAEFMPWILQIFVSIGLFLYVMSFIFSFVRSFGRGRV